MATKPGQINLAILKEQTGSAITNLVVTQYTQIIMDQNRSALAFANEAIEDLKSLAAEFPEVKKRLVFTDEGYTLKPAEPNASKG